MYFYFFAKIKLVEKKRKLEKLIIKKKTLSRIEQVTGSCNKNFVNINEQLADKLTLKEKKILPAVTNK